MQCQTIYDYAYPWDQFWLVTTFGLFALGFMAWEMRAPSYPHSSKITRLRALVFGLFAAFSFAMLPYGAIRALVKEPATVEVSGEVTSFQSSAWRLSMPPVQGEICLDDVCYRYPQLGVGYGFSGRLDLVDRVGRKSARLEQHLRIGDALRMDLTPSGEILHIAHCRAASKPPQGG